MAEEKAKDEASTGPRSIERGRAAKLLGMSRRWVELQRGVARGDGHHRCRASTGPRSIERGRQVACSVPDGRWADASTGPRSIERGRNSSLRPLMAWAPLQRGRAQLSAEGGADLSGAGLSWALQRGRAQLSAEGNSLGLKGVIYRQLQRGRAQLSAEGNCGSLVSLGWRGFNGAALN